MAENICSYAWQALDDASILECFFPLSSLFFCHGSIFLNVTTRLQQVYQPLTALRIKTSLLGEDWMSRFHIGQIHQKRHELLFLSQNRLTKVLTKPLCQKKTTQKPTNPRPNQSQDTGTSFETFPKLLLAQNSGVPVPNWFNGTDRGAAQGSLHGECFLEELL